MFSANYLPNVGGVERYTYNLAKKLAQRGNNVIIVTSNVFCLGNMNKSRALRFTGFLAIIGLMAGFLF